MEPLSIFAKSLVLDILLSSECASAYSSFGRNTVQVPEKKLVIIINFILIKTPEPFLEYIQNFSIGVIASFEI